MLTFGIEIELVEFYNNEPIIGKEISLLKNPQVSNNVLWGEWTILREKTEGNWKEKIVDLIGIDIMGEEEIYKIPLSPTGNVLPPWESFPADDDSTTDASQKGSAIHQAQKLLEANQLQNWKAVYDSSLTDAAINGIELVSPALKSGDFDSVEQVCQIFSDITKIDRTCAIHVHIGIEGQSFQYEQIRRLVRWWIEAEPFTWEFPFYKETRVQFGRPLTWESNISDLQSGIRNATDLDELKSVVNPKGRNYLVNLLALEKHGTIEFRGFKSTLDCQQIKKMVALCELKVRESL